ncbi:MAG TPA: STAS domain-containing protein [Solirubrobacteraceae bacterium]|jgi:anti-sigma B factor antagonist|nr:STAS domain-containing protein [Solirubrobacteraceae bacterium]
MDDVALVDHHPPRVKEATVPSSTQTSTRSQPPAPEGRAASATTFEIVQRELDERTCVIEVEGELDLSTAPRLKWTLLDALQAGHGRLVVDLSRTTFMDSTALGVLVAAKRGLAAGERLAIVCPRSDVLQIFEFAGMDGAFAILPALDEALASVREDGAPPS